MLPAACRRQGLTFSCTGALESQRKGLPCGAQRGQSERCDRRAEGCDGKGGDLPATGPRRHTCGTQSCGGVSLVRPVLLFAFSRNSC